MLRVEHGGTPSGSCWRRRDCVLRGHFFAPSDENKRPAKKRDALLKSKVRSVSPGPVTGSILGQKLENRPRWACGAAPRAFVSFFTRAPRRKKKSNHRK